MEMWKDRSKLKSKSQCQEHYTKFLILSIESYALYFNFKLKLNPFHLIKLDYLNKVQISTPQYKGLKGKIICLLSLHFIQRPFATPFLICNQIRFFTLLPVWAKLIHFPNSGCLNPSETVSL